MGIGLDHIPDFSSDVQRSEYWAARENDSIVVVVRPGMAVPTGLPDRLSLRAAFGGRLVHKVGDARLGVDDDVFLVTNARTAVQVSGTAEYGCTYLSLHFSEPTLRRCLQKFPAAAIGQRETVGFLERLRPHEPGIAPLIRAFASGAALTAPDDRAAWERRAEELLLALLAARRRDTEHVASLAHARERTRHEIYRRVYESTDYLLSHYDEPLQLKQLADVACLAKFHYLRMFVAVHGVTPMEYLRCKRVAVASRLLLADAAPLGAIAKRVGVADRSTLLRLFIDYRATTPDQYRRDHASRGPESVPDNLLLDLVSARAQSKTVATPAPAPALAAEPEQGYPRFATAD